MLLKYTVAAFLILIPGPVLGSAGVSINVGTITLEEPLTPGGIYELTPIAVQNTGDLPSQYEMDVVYLQDQREKKPPKEWVEFTPHTFYLEPGESQVVNSSLVLPINTEAGDYFAHIEARPVTENGGIQIAVASKLNFSIQDASLWGGIINKIKTITAQYAPWSIVAFAVFFTAIPVVLIKKHYELKIESGNRKNRTKVKSFELIPRE